MPEREGTRRPNLKAWVFSIVGVNEYPHKKGNLGKFKPDGVIFWLAVYPQYRLNNPIILNQQMSASHAKICPTKFQ